MLTWRQILGIVIAGEHRDPDSFTMIVQGIKDRLPVAKSEMGEEGVLFEPSRVASSAD